QLGRSLRAGGHRREPDAQSAAAAAEATARTRSDRENLDRFMREGGEGPGGEALTIPLDSGPIGAMSKPAREALHVRVSAALLRANQNLGVLLAQAGRFDRAAVGLERAAAIDPAAPNVQYSLGVAYFNLHRYDKAAPALTQAVAADPKNTDARRMLALSCLNVEDFGRAVDLLHDDPLKDTDPSLQLAYGMALVRSGRAAEAEARFAKLLSAHADSAEANVVLAEAHAYSAECHVALGQAHAEQGDYDAAVASLKRAIELKPAVAEANASLGLISLKQGKLEESTQALQTELKAHPSDVKTRYTLATVYELDRRPDEALREVRTVLKM